MFLLRTELSLDKIFSFHAKNLGYKKMKSLILQQNLDP